MDVEDRVRIRRHEFGTKQAHETRETYQRHASLTQLGDNGAVEFVARRVGAMFEHQRLDTRRGRAIQPRRIGSVRNHERNRCVQPRLGNGIDDRL